MTNKLRKIYYRFLIFSFYFVLFLIFIYLPKITSFFFDSTKVINIYTFTDMISPQVIEEFEKRENIKIKLKYFDNNEELLAKFRIDQGRECDLLTASDHAIESLKKEKLLDKLDKTKIFNIDQLDKRLLNLYFDRDNIYSIPLDWSAFGIVIPKKEVSNLDLNLGLGLIFKKQNNLQTKICMTDGIKESIFLAALYLFKRTTNLTEKELEDIKNLLIEQKNWIEIYMSGSVQYYLLAKIVSMAVSSSAFANKLLQTSQDYHFLIPEPSLIVVDNIALPVKTSDNKKKLVYKFIDFLISKEAAIINNQAYGYYPSNVKAYKQVSNFNDEKFDKLYLINNQIDSKKIGEIWLKVRLA